MNVFSIAVPAECRVFPVPASATCRDGFFLSLQIIIAGLSRAECADAGI